MMKLSKFRTIIYFVSKGSKFNLLQFLTLAVLTSVLAIGLKVDFYGYKVDFIRSEVMGFEQKIWYHDLNEDGNSERLEYRFENEDHHSLAVIGDDRVIEHYSFNGEKFPNNTLYDQSSSNPGHDLCTFIFRYDSLFCILLNPIDDNSRMQEIFITILPENFQQTDLHIETIGWINRDTEPELLVMLGSRWLEIASQSIRINPKKGVAMQNPLPTRLSNPKIFKLPNNEDLIIYGDLYLNRSKEFRSDSVLEINLPVLNQSLSPLFPAVPVPAFTSMIKVFPIVSGGETRIAAIIDNPERLNSRQTEIRIYSLSGQQISTMKMPMLNENPTWAFFRNMNYRLASLNREESNSLYGFSVRCIKNIDDCNINPLKDLRDNQVYQTVKIGDQIWMAQNLNYEGSKPNWKVPEDSISDGKYGRLYTWESAIRACPQGWHLPTDAEWQVMEIYAGMNKAAYELGWRKYGNVGRKIQAREGWINDKTTNETGFSSLPVGHWEINDSIRNYGKHSYFWTSTQADEWMIYQAKKPESPCFVIHTSGFVQPFQTDGLKSKPFSIPRFKLPKYQISDLDGEGEDEFIYLANRGEKIAILNSHLSHPKELAITYRHGEAILSPNFKKGQVENWYLQNGDQVWEFAFLNNNRWLSTLYVLLIFGGLFFLMAISQAIQRSRTMKKLETEEKILHLQYQGLASQFNPHLTFNLFNTVSGFIGDNQKDIAIELTHKYAKLLRRTMFNGRNFKISLQEELETVIDYLDLEVLISEGLFNYQIDINSEFFGYGIPRSLLYMFVENGIKHGTRTQPVSPTIRIIGREESSGLIIEVMDNGFGTFHQENGKPSGTRNGFKIIDEVLQLYRLRTGSDIKYEFIPCCDPSPDKFTLIRLTLPTEKH